MTDDSVDTEIFINKYSNENLKFSLTPNSRSLKECSVLLGRPNIAEDLGKLNINTPSPLRRGTRNRTTPKVYTEFFENSSPEKRKKQIKRDADTSDSDDDIGNSHQVKATSLFSNGDIEGQDIFKFKSRHTKLDLQNKVNTAIYNSPNLSDSCAGRTPRTSLTASKIASSINRPLVESTPKCVKDIMKKRIIRQMESEESNSDFSGSSSDFVPEKSDNESSESSCSEESEEEIQQKPSRVQLKKSNEVRGKARRDTDYVVQPDSYFMMHSNKKITTSDHTLERLKNYNNNAESGADAEQEFHISEEHQTKIRSLNEHHEHLFNKWLYLLGGHYSVLLYGVGSKRTILQRFQATKLKDFPCVVVNGFFPSLTMKSILESIIIDLLECSQVPSNIRDAVALIDEVLTENDAKMFLIIHNIDGVMLQNSKAQMMLASLSAIDNVHTIATIDHINAPLVWDHTKLSQFNFTWWDVTTFLPYGEETSYENSLLAQRGGALQLGSLRSVYRSLTTNAKGIFNIIVQHQLLHQKLSHYQGLPFKDLYSKSREQFLVSSDIALRAQLTEFLDHKLVRSRRAADGSENLLVPAAPSLLQQFLDQLD